MVKYIQGLFVYNTWISHNHSKIVILAGTTSSIWGYEKSYRPGDNPKWKGKYSLEQDKENWLSI